MDEGLKRAAIMYNTPQKKSIHGYDTFMTALLPTAILIPLLASMLCPFVSRLGKGAAHLWALAAAAASFFSVVWNIPPLIAGDIIQLRYPWVDFIGLQLSLQMDGLSLIFALLITGIGTLIVLYAWSYLHSNEPLGQFYAAFLLFMASMLGVVCSANILLLVIFWELTSFSSFLLIGFWSHKADARQGAYKAFFITSAGGLALLAAFLLIGKVAGSYEWSEILRQKDVIRQHAWAPWILFGLLLGIFTKSAQWPFHIWLPNAMEAPTPVSAYLHAATMVKAGIFLLGRFFPIFGDHPIWLYGVSSIGMITLLMGSYMALKQHDLKAMLAYSTVSQLGLLTSLYGAGSLLGVGANAYHILSHACYKGALFLLVGVIDHAAGTRDIRKLSGLYSVLPYTGFLMALAALSMSGIPPFMGFLSKELFLNFVLDLTRKNSFFLLFPAMGVLAAAFTVAFSLKIVHGVFWGRPLPSDLRHMHRPPLVMKLAPLILASAGLVFGLFPEALKPVLNLTVSGQPDLRPPELHLWHGFSWALALSILAIALGSFLYYYRDTVDRFQNRIRSPWTLHLLYDRLMEGIVTLAAYTTRWTLPENVRSAVILFLCVVGGMAAAAGMEIKAWPRTLDSLEPFDFLPASVLSAILIGMIVLLRVKDRIAKVIVLGVIGFLLVFLFVWIGAPDLALTQFLVEVVMLILFVIVLKRMPESRLDYRKKWEGAGAAMTAVAAGGLLSMVVWAMLSNPPSGSVSHYFVQNAYTLAGGRNIVNVILVDFRGYDTLGEITVVAMAGLGVYSLLKKRTKA